MNQQIRMVEIKGAGNLPYPLDANTIYVLTTKELELVDHPIAMTRCSAIVSPVETQIFVT